MKKRSILSFAIMALLAAAPSQAQDQHISEIDTLFTWAAPPSPGCAVAVSRHGDVVVNRAYGLADLEGNVPLTTDTRFDAGSLVKQFVAAATLLLVEDGRLSLTDDVRKHIPELPDPGHTVTIDHLLTHTSGVRDWTGIRPFAAGDPDALTIALRQRGLNFAPGEEWEYSNGGYVLLKEIVARASGMPFADFTRTRLFEPLGMKRTVYVLDMRDVDGLARAYEKSGRGWRPDMLIDNARGGGGALMSTASDLLIWNDALAGARLGTFVSEKMHEPARLNNGRTLRYARALFLDENYGSRVIWHTGSAAGYKSLLSRFPDQGLSIAILCNAGDSVDRTAYAGKIFDLFVSPTGTRPAEPAAPADAIEGVDVSGRAGLFFNERTGEPLRLVVNEGKLRAAGGPALVAIAQDRFRNVRPSMSFMSDATFDLRFVSDDAFELRSMEGETARYRRAQAYAPDRAALDSFAGQYESSEVGSTFVIAAGDQGLVVSLAHAPSRSIPFTPVDRDTFQRGMMTLRFQRDAGGKVSGFAYSNPLIRNVPFTRR